MCRCSHVGLLVFLPLCTVCAACLVCNVSQTLCQELELERKDVWWPRSTATVPTGMVSKSTKTQCTDMLCVLLANFFCFQTIRHAGAVSCMPFGQLIHHKSSDTTAWCACKIAMADGSRSPGSILVHIRLKPSAPPVTKVTFNAGVMQSTAQTWRI